MKTVGIITYDCHHLKTEQLVLKYVRNKQIKKINIYALSFNPRKQRQVLFQHRPDMNIGVHTSCLKDLNKVSYRKWDGKEIISDDCDFFVIGGAGILDVRFANGKPIVNAHPGIIPLTRGLDSFKWAIYNGDPIGVSIHLIDQEVDRGELIKIFRTPIFKSDSIETLSRRHYELEIDMMGNIVDYIHNRESSVEEEKPATMRMNKEKEKVMLDKFESWKMGLLT